MLWSRINELFIYFLDVISIEKTGENFRLIYDVKGRFIVHRITNEEAKVRLNYLSEIVFGTMLCNSLSRMGQWMFFEAMHIFFLF